MRLLGTVSEERCHALSGCLKKLPDADKRLVECRYGHGLGSHATAELLERSQASVCNSLRRIRQVLLRCINGALSQEQLS